MKKIAIATTTAIALLAAPAAFAKPRPTGEQQLAKVLEGRVAGKPLDCLPMEASSDMQVIDRTAIVYGRGNTIYVNRPSNARTLDSDNILVRKSHTARVCNLDIVDMVDQASHMRVGTVGLNKFVPYTKVAKKH